MKRVDLKSVLANGNEDQIIDALQNAARGPQQTAALQLIEKLASATRSAAVRNAAALALLDWKAPNAAELMLELVARPDTRGKRGTLLYVLNELNASVPLSLVLEILAKDSYEARAEALALLASADHRSGNVEHALPVLRRLAESSDREAAEHAREAIEILTSAT